MLTLANKYCELVQLNEYGKTSELIWRSWKGMNFGGSSVFLQSFDRIDLISYAYNDFQHGLEFSMRDFRRNMLISCFAKQLKEVSPRLLAVFNVN